MSVRLRRLLVAMVLGIAVVAAGVTRSAADPTPSPTASSPTASSPTASSPTTMIVAPIHLNFALTGSLSLPSFGGSGKISAGALTADVNLRDGAISGDAKLADIAVGGTLYGFIPVVVTLAFTQVGPLDGSLAPTSQITVAITANVTVKSVNAFGALPLTYGACTLATPVHISLKSNGTEPFRPLIGGTVIGTFTTGTLANCGSLTDALNLVFPSAHNELTIVMTGKQ